MAGGEGTQLLVRAIPSSIMEEMEKEYKSMGEAEEFLSESGRPSQGPVWLGAEIERRKRTAQQSGRGGVGGAAAARGGRQSSRSLPNPSLDSGRRAPVSRVWARIGIAPSERFRTSLSAFVRM